MKKGLILDEALNGLEESEEVSILKEVLEFYKNNTVIYITHSSKTICLFDSIMNLKEVI